MTSVSFLGRFIFNINFFKNNNNKKKESKRDNCSEPLGIFEKKIIIKERKREQKGEDHFFETRTLRREKGRTDTEVYEK